MVDILNKLQTVVAKLFERNDHCSFTTLINIEHGVWKQKFILRNSLLKNMTHNITRTVLYERTSSKIPHIRTCLVRVLVKRSTSISSSHVISSVLLCVPKDSQDVLT